jgi:hypothetical protein
VLEKASETQPVVRVTIGDVDTVMFLPKVFAQAAIRSAFSKVSSASMRIASVGPEISVLLDGAHVANFTFSELIRGGMGPHRGDLDVDRERAGAHLSYSFFSGSSREGSPRYSPGFCAWSSAI